MKAITIFMVWCLGHYCPSQIKVYLQRIIGQPLEIATLTTENTVSLQEINFKRWAEIKGSFYFRQFFPGTGKNNENKILQTGR